MSALKKAFDRLMMQVLAEPGNIKPDLSRENPKHLERLQSEGYLDAEGQMTPSAFMLYFERFEKLECAEHAQRWVTELNVGELHWRRAGGVIAARLEQERGTAYPQLRTIFIGKDADQGTWLHELGHVLYYLRLSAHHKARLGTEARKQFPLLRSDEITNAGDPVSRQPTRLPDGVYMLINKRYCGIDHSGTAEDEQNDEIWANVFVQYWEDRGVLPESVSAIVDEILSDIKVVGTPTCAEDGGLAL